MTPSPLVAALRAALDEALETRRRRELERAATRAKMRIVEPRKAEAA